MIPDDVIDEAERLTRRAREASGRATGEDGAGSREAEPWSDAVPPSGEPYEGPSEADRYRERRDDLLAEHGYVARVRTEGDADTLVLHPSDWLDEDGTVIVDRIDVEDGVEVELEGTGDADEWSTVDTHNRAAAAAVAEAHGEVHGENARRLAEFASNHYAKPVEELTPGEREEFVTEYFPRNAWPTDGQRAVVEESVELACETGADLER